MQRYGMRFSAYAQRLQRQCQFSRNNSLLANRSMNIVRQDQRYFCTPAATHGTDVRTILGMEVSDEQVPEAVLKALSIENATREEARRDRKKMLIETYRRSPSDTGSPEVQIAILTDRIRDLTTHVQRNKKDQGSKRILIKIVAQRRKLMQYLLRKDSGRYMTLVTELKLRPSSVFSKDTPLGAKKAPTPQLY